jgi:hypothetical protein
MDGVSSGISDDAALCGLSIFGRSDRSDAVSCASSWGMLLRVLAKVKPSVPPSID